MPVDRGTRVATLEMPGYICCHSARLHLFASTLLIRFPVTGVTASAFVMPTEPSRQTSTGVTRVNYHACVCHCRRGPVSQQCIILVSRLCAGPRNAVVMVVGFKGVPRWVVFPISVDRRVRQTAKNKDWNQFADSGRRRWFARRGRGGECKGQADDIWTKWTANYFTIEHSTDKRRPSADVREERLI